MSSPKSIFSFKIESNVHLNFGVCLTLCRRLEDTKQYNFQCNCKILLKNCKMFGYIYIKILHFRWSLQEAEDWRGGWGHVLGPRPLPQPLVLLPHPRQAEAQDYLHTGTTGVRAFSNFQVKILQQMSQFTCCMYLVLV